MLNSVVLCWWMLNMVQVAFGLVRTNRMEDSHPSLRRSEAPLLSDLSSIPGVDAMRLGIESVEEQLIEDQVSYDEYPQDLAEAVQLQRRGTRSPGRCIPHQQSCLGHQLPCCDACDTCYCRFFKAFCYCRSMDHSCKHGRV